MVRNTKETLKMGQNKAKGVGLLLSETTTKENMMRIWNMATDNTIGKVVDPIEGCSTKEDVATKTWTILDKSNNSQRRIQWIMPQSKKIEEKMW